MCHCLQIMKEHGTIPGYPACLAAYFENQGLNVTVYLGCTPFYIVRHIMARGNMENNDEWQGVPYSALDFISQANVYVDQCLNC